MRIGSIVVLIRPIPQDLICEEVKNIPVIKTHYTIRGESEPGYFLFEEFIMGFRFKSDNIEIGIRGDLLREIQFPDDLQEQITEALTRELILQP